MRNVLALVPHGKKAQVAAARKLLRICWACVKHGREFDAGYADRWR
jgi:hypothetical protein